MVDQRCSQAIVMMASAFNGIFPDYDTEAAKNNLMTTHATIYDEDDARSHQHCSWRFL
jgi:hypothetical protein